MHAGHRTQQYAGWGGGAYHSQQGVDRPPPMTLQPGRGLAVPGQGPGQGADMRMGSPPHVLPMAPQRRSVSPVLPGGLRVTDSADTPDAQPRPFPRGDEDEAAERRRQVAELQRREAKVCMGARAAANKGRGEKDRSRRVQEILDADDSDGDFNTGDPRSVVYGLCMACFVWVCVFWDGRLVQKEHV